MENQVRVVEVEGEGRDCSGTWLQVAIVFSADDALFIPIVTRSAAAAAAAAKGCREHLMLL